MGESVAEATITNWLKQVGDKIEADEAVLEIATDKVDSEVPSEVSGVLVEQLFGKDDLVQVGQTIAIIETESPPATEGGVQKEEDLSVSELEKNIVSSIAKSTNIVSAPPSGAGGLSEKFFSPLVKNIAKEEGISLSELENISGSGKDGRVTKEDILKFVADRKTEPKVKIQEPVISKPIPTVQQPTTVSINGGDEIIEMDRMRKLIAGYMVASVQTSAHVQSF
ncbi:MAG: E3 binding domain-containing protein, partial [Lentimicrobium sp.]|nr:E3 binding domain-containing protein [Lentimicrobium sp.]